MFTGILNCRIVLWSEAKSIIAECQAGFRQGRSTIDQIFILKTIVDKFLFRKKGRIYCMFVDFSQAFDTVNRDHFIYTLIKQGFHGKMLKLVREIYSKVKAAVRTKEGLNKLFDCILGVRQGCMLSPRLFIIFINELESMLRKSEYREIAIGNTIEIFLLMYADDILLLGDTVLELKRKLEGVLEEFCGKWGMEINLSKAKVTAFSERRSHVQIEFPNRREKIKSVTVSRAYFFLEKLVVKSVRYQHWQHRHRKLSASLEE